MLEKPSGCRRVRPTEEQKKIMGATGRVVKVNARAGTGKTTTLRLIAQHHPDKKILYLVFNRKNREEAERTFPANVKVRSVHAFALNSLSSLGKRFEIDRRFTACRFLPCFEEERNRQALAALTHQFLMFFLNSRFAKLEEAVGFYRAGYLTDEQQTLFDGHEERIVRITRQFSTAWNRGEKPCPDDFYLKLSHLKKTFHGALEKFDLILVDEGQDLSQVMVDALAHCTKRIVLVGDTHQRIYGFRYAVDAMRQMTCDEQFDLSRSFRFGAPIAELVSRFIADAKQEPAFTIRGDKKKSAGISFYSDLSGLEKGSTAILSRTNMALFRNAMGLRAAGRRFRFERDIRAELMKTLDVCRLYRGEKDQIRDEWIRSFESLEQLERFAEQVQDFQLINVAQIVKEYAAEFPGAIYQMMKLAGRKKDVPDDPDAIILSTVHAAKGREYERVVIDPDIAEAIGRTANKDPEQFSEEVNVAYVCLTRAQGTLLLPQAMKKILSPEWKGYLEGLSQTVWGRGIEKKPQGSRRVLQKPSSSIPPAGPSYGVGDRVKTSNGYGTIIAIDGDQYHVSLEGQRVRLRENLTALNFYNR